jgi:hypothetical protein
MAKQYGIDAFCYYHYWFAGKELLERPFKEVVDSGANCKIAGNGGIEARRGPRIAVSCPFQHPLGHIPLGRHGFIQFPSKRTSSPDGVYRFAQGARRLIE